MCPGGNDVLLCLHRKAADPKFLALAAKIARLTEKISVKHGMALQNLAYMHYFGLVNVAGIHSIQHECIVIGPFCIC